MGSQEIGDGTATESAGDTTSDTVVLEAPSEVAACATGKTQCVDETIYRCVDGRFEPWEECAPRGFTCSLIQGEAVCIEGAPNTDDTWEPTGSDTGQTGSSTTVSETGGSDSSTTSTSVGVDTSTDTGIPSEVNTGTLETDTEGSDVGIVETDTGGSDTGTVETDTGGSDTGTVETDTGGSDTGINTDHYVVIDLVADGEGWTDDSTNALGIQGVWFEYIDEGYSTLERDGQCASGTIAQVVANEDGDLAWDDIWGGGIGFTLCETREDDRSSETKFVISECPFNANLADEFKGVRFDLTGDIGDGPLYVQFGEGDGASAYIPVYKPGPVVALIEEARIFWDSSEPPAWFSVNTLFLLYFHFGWAGVFESCSE